MSEEDQWSQDDSSEIKRPLLPQTMCGGFGKASMKRGSACGLLLIDVSAQFPTQRQRFFHCSEMLRAQGWAPPHTLPGASSPHPLPLITAPALPGNHRITESIKIGKDLWDHSVQPMTEHHPVKAHFPSSATSSLKHLQRQWLHRLPGRPIPVPEVKKFFLMSNINLLWYSLRLSPHPIAVSLGGEPDPHLATKSFQRL